MMDALLPPEMAARAEEIGVTKAGAERVRTFVLAILAGAFIALGAVFSTVVVSGAAGILPFGVIRLLAGLAFSLGLVLVSVGGAELFTGNNLIVMAWASGKISIFRLLRNWCLVYLGNFTGALATAGIVFLADHHRLGGGLVGETAIQIAHAKMGHGMLPAFLLGVLGNALVCLAVWLTYSARTTVDRIIAVVPPITAFVAAGFEHCIANMYFIPFAMLIEGPGSITWSAFVFKNLLPVTLGNCVGGALLVGAMYWFVYHAAARGLRSRSAQRSR
ncbi:MAG: formate/nitrite transporter family protein [Bdellovibrionota bacterium]